MTVDATEVPWPKRAEAAIRSLRDVEAASIQTEDDEIREIHVLTSSSRPAKQIVRDVQTLLLTRFNRPIDHRVVSVAYARPGPSLAPRAPRLPGAEPQEESTRRIRFGSVNLYVSSGRAQAQVELGWKGVSRLGTATGSATRDGAQGLICDPHGGSGIPRGRSRFELAGHGVTEAWQARRNRGIPLLAGPPEREDSGGVLHGGAGCPAGGRPGDPRRPQPGGGGPQDPRTNRICLETGVNRGDQRSEYSNRVAKRAHLTGSRTLTSRDGRKGGGNRGPYPRSYHSLYQGRLVAVGSPDPQSRGCG